MDESTANIPDTLKGGHQTGEKPVILEAKEASKTYENASQKIAALQPINLQVREGEFVVFFGPSGCGKSTLLNLIAGFETPTTGEIALEGKPILKPGPDRLMLFQEHALFPWLNVMDNVIYGLKRHRKYRFKRKLRRQRARDLLKMVHLEEFEKASIHELSGGMKQRVALATTASGSDLPVSLFSSAFRSFPAAEMSAAICCVTSTWARSSFFTTSPLTSVSRKCRPWNLNVRRL